MTAGSTKQWFIEINPNAECYNRVEGILNALKGDLAFYAWIWHDKDEEDDGTLKAKHAHMALEFAKPKTFEQVQGFFKGAHIEKALSLAKAVAYLTHETWQAKEEGKHLYERMAVSVNDRQRYFRLVIEGSIEPFNPYIIPDYVERGITSEIVFMKIFGYQTYKTEWQAYSRLSASLKKSKDIEARLAKLEADAREVYRLLEPLYIDIYNPSKPKFHKALEKLEEMGGIITEAKADD